MPLTARALPLVVLGLALAGPAYGDCSIELSPVTFGVVDLTSRSRGTGEVVVRCDEAGSFTVGISNGRGGKGSRQMIGPGGGNLEYRLFSDSGRTIPWGDGLAEGQPVAGSSDGESPQRLTIYGAVPAQSGIVPGEYVDSVEVTLTF
jgi:spore coat protein U-like protein